jgi:hypothetical protein
VLRGGSGCAVLGEHAVAVEKKVGGRHGGEEDGWETQRSAVAEMRGFFKSVATKGERRERIG